MNHRIDIAGILLTDVLAVVAVISVRRFKMSPAGGVSAAGGSGTTEPQNVTVFAVEISSFTDAIDGLEGTVTGYTIEISYFGPE